MNSIRCAILYCSVACTGFSLCFAQTFVETDKLVSSDRMALQHFGFSVAVSDKFAVVGSFSAAYIFERHISGTWKHVVKLTNPERSGGGFGQKIFLNGSTAFICASYLDVVKDDSMFEDAGAVFVYERHEIRGWEYREKLLAEDLSKAGYFGSSIAASGNYVIIGAHRESKDAFGSNRSEGAGAAYVFKKEENGKWIQKQKLTASDRTSADFFGVSASLAGDNMIIGASADTRVDPQPHNGSAYIFTKNNDGQWIEIQKIIAGQEDIKAFGKGVAISSTYAIITNGSRQLAHVFEKDQSGRWKIADHLIPSEQSGLNSFGSAVSISEQYAVVGASFQEKLNQGAVYLFLRTEEGKWKEKQIFTSSQASSGNEFGASISLANNMVLVGSFLDEKDRSGENLMERAGSAYVYTLQQDKTSDKKPPAARVERCPPFDRDFEIPNVITPNGDGFNDSFYVARLFDRSSLVVFDRYGKAIYENSDYSNEWLPENITPGIYFWKIIQQKNNCFEEFKGWVRILK